MTKKKTFLFGPAVLVTAAFIGPGTVMMASKAGSEYGFLLLWAVGFSVVATIVLQEMAARLGIVTGDGLSQALKSTISNRLAKFLVLGLVMLAILVGNAAYQTGNILGAASGVKAISAQAGEPGGNGEIQEAASASWLDSNSRQFQDGVVVLIGVLAIVVIWVGRFDVLQLILTLMVACMSLLFIYAAIKSGPDWNAVLSGFVPRVPKGGEWVVIGLIGTTVVPYNLFLHASAAAEQWTSNHDAQKPVDFRDAIASSRLDTIMSVVVGGIVTCAILVTAAVAFHSDSGAVKPTLNSVKDVAVQLEPVLGKSSRILFALGLLAAGLTSAITAPVAAGFAAAGCFGWSGKLDDPKLKITATGVVVAGVYFAIWFGKSPKETIIIAQVANGILLPVIAVFLLVMVNRTDLMKEYKNRKLTNALGVVVVLIVTLIAVRQFDSVRSKIQKMFDPPKVETRLIDHGIQDPSLETEMTKLSID